ncbi:LacI family DNA-binding transcriptional regulator [Curtobacterium sp. MCLR17_007]|uniref:LacI family DNA-binding transcriptional regulator n=1 Tax=Curtobacterium sp. MCLR17_007 TaxID=2175648 RepID=UPI000DA96BE0|nr:LacI family DNA-binding transcriptional regulator [Curtobacterium sp. MCLR17_007]WIB59636.1 LacI family DNA-binding transcriptional regulator [Curtobacterium sp. MCLR17_007]
MQAASGSGPTRKPAMTVKDIARVAEVSPMTVSRVLSGGKNVRPALREHVERVIAEVGYHRNENARSLRPGQRSGLVGVMITNIGNPYYAGVVQGIEQVVAATGRRILVGTTNEDADLERQLLSDFLGRQVEGLVVVPVGPDVERFTTARLHDVPLVLASRTVRDVPADAVLIDDVHGAHAATAMMLEDGHRRIAFLGNKVTVSTGQRRLTGFRRAFAEHGTELDDALVVLGLQDTDTAERAMRELLGRAEAPTAVFAANNRISVGAIRAIAKGVADGTVDQPPRLFAFDSFDFADMAPIPLSVIDHDPAELGRVAARMLLSRLDGSADGEPPRLVELPVHIVHH